MKGVIFKLKEIDLWNKLLKELDKINAKDSVADKHQYCLNFIHQTLKSYRPSPNGNGIKWSKEEKAKFLKLSYKEQRKMIVRKSELKSTLFPYVNVDYEPYTYSERISDMAKKTYDKANKLLESHSKIDFNNLNPKIQQDILQNLRIAYKEQYLKAGVELSKLLFKKASLKGGDESKKEILECNKIVKDLLREKIPEISYMYYQLYKWSSDNERLFHTELTPFSLGLVKEEAKECYNHALECVVWEAIDEEAQREEWKQEIPVFAAELYLAAAIKYQSPLAFYLAASNYAPQGVWTNAYALIPHHACLRCAIALGSENALDTLIPYYGEGLDIPQSTLKFNMLGKYAEKSPQQKGLINGLDPYFDEKFSPDMLIDLTLYADGCLYGGSGNSMGLSYAVYDKRIIKDPRDKDSTLDSIKEYYLVMWQIIVDNFKLYTFSSNKRTLFDILNQKIYSNLTHGLPSARPYIFPKEVLDLKIDFNKGLEGYGKIKE